MFDVTRTQPVADFLTVSISAGRIGEWRVETIKVPVCGARIASDDFATTQRRLVTLATEDRLAFAILGFEVIRELIIAGATPDNMSVSDREKKARHQE